MSRRSIKFHFHLEMYSHQRMTNPILWWLFFSPSEIKKTVHYFHSTGRVICAKCIHNEFRIFVAKPMFLMHTHPPIQHSRSRCLIPVYVILRGNHYNLQPPTPIPKRSKRPGTHSQLCPRWPGRMPQPVCENVGMPLKPTGTSPAFMTRAPLTG